MIRFLTLWAAAGIVVAACSAAPTRLATEQSRASIAPAVSATSGELPTASPSPAALPSAAPTAVPTATPKPTPLSFRDGTYKVGVDLAPGTYRTRESVSACRWTRLAGFGGTPEETIAAGNARGFSVVTIDAGDTGFTSSGCGAWSADLSAVTATRTAFGDGTFVVSVDMVPGAYRSGSKGTCLWSRLSGFGGTFDEVIDNDIVQSPTRVAIEPADKGFFSQACGSWARE